MFSFRSRKRKISNSSLNTSLSNGHGEDHSIRNENLALGTSSGAVFIYSTRTGEVQTTLRDDDMGMINALVSFDMKKKKHNYVDIQ